MTIALGVLAKDSVILAADTQETYSGGFKVNQGKILATLRGSFQDPKGALAVSGAGTATQLDALQQQLCRVFLRDESTDMDRTRELLNATVAEFVATHILPYSGWPEYDRPGCSLVFAATLDKKLGLWTSDKSAIREVPYGAVGIGAPHAHLLLTRLWQPLLNTQVATLLAAYVMFVVKQSVDGCGKDTHIVVLPRDAAPYVVGVQRVERLEHEFSRYSDEEDLALQHILGIGITKSASKRKQGHHGLALVRSRLSRIYRSVERVDSTLRRSQVGLWTNEYPPFTKKS